MRQLLIDLRSYSPLKLMGNPRDQVVTANLLQATGRLCRFSASYGAICRELSKADPTTGGEDGRRC
jgi:hypothetical protein